jgi:hypothetical protein
MVLNMVCHKNLMEMAWLVGRNRRGGVMRALKRSHVWVNRVKDFGK